MYRARTAVFALFALALVPAAAGAQQSVFLDDLTWTEVRDALAAGKTTAIVPTGGTEQNGPHMILGKHNYIVHYAAGEIAKRLGNALVAPVVTYVPEGNIDPPTGHMWAPGTITLPNEHFEVILEYAARSLRAHGFTDILLIGDSGGNQAGQANVARRLNEEWAGTPARVHHVSHYYTDDNGVIDWLLAQGETRESIGTHAGINDTSQLLAIHPEGIRLDQRAIGVRGDGSGVTGDPTRASAAYGQEIMRLRIEAAVRQVEQLRAASRAP